MTNAVITLMSADTKNSTNCAYSNIKIKKIIVKVDFWDNLDK